MSFSIISLKILYILLNEALRSENRLTLKHSGDNLEGEKFEFINLAKPVLINIEFKNLFLGLKIGKIRVKKSNFEFNV